MADRIVITGAQGQLGRILGQEAARQGRSVLALTSAEWDITDPSAAERVVEPGDIVMNCAAYTRVDDAESDDERAHAVNTLGPEYVAHACARAGAELIHISTDYVFSGVFEGTQPNPYQPDDGTGPLSVYGRTKLAGEFAVLTAMPDAHIVRTSWLYGALSTDAGSGTDFVGAMVARAAGDGPVRVVADQVGSPTYVKDLSVALLELADSPDREPVLHIANEGAVSRYDQAVAVFEEVGGDLSRLAPVSTADMPRPARRPGYSALSSRASWAAGLTPLRPWREALAAALSSCPLPSTP